MINFFLLFIFSSFLFPCRWRYLNDFLQNRLNISGFLNLTYLNKFLSPNDVIDFSRRFSNNTATLREFFEIDANLNYQQNKTIDFDFLSKITNFKEPLVSIIPNSVALIIKENIDDVIYFSETYTEFFEMLNIIPAHWRMLFTSFKNDFEGMTLSRCFAFIGLNIQPIVDKVNIIFTSLSNQISNKKITIENLHQKLGFKPKNSYINLANNLNRINDTSIIISPSYIYNLSITSSIYIYSAATFSFDFCNSLFLSTFGYMRTLFDFINLPLRERIVLFRKGVEKLRLASDSSLFKRLILYQIDFLNELSYYASNFLNDDFKMSQFFIELFKYDKENYQKEINSINNFLTNSSLIEFVNKSILLKPIGNFLTKHIHNYTFSKENISLRFLFQDSESFNNAIKRIINYSDRDYEIPVLLSIQKSLQKIVNKDSTFEKEFNFDALKINSILKDMKEITIRQFLIKYTKHDFGDSLNNFATFLNFVSKLHQKYFSKYNPSLFDKIKEIGNSLRNKETRFPSIFETIDDGSSIIIDVFYDFTKSIIENKEPNEVLKSIPKGFLDFDKTVNNIINFDTEKSLSFKNFNETIVIEKLGKFTFYDLVPLDKIILWLDKLAQIAKEKNDITIGNFRFELNNSTGLFRDLSDFVKRSSETPIINVIKSLFKQYVHTEIDIDTTFEKIKGLMRDIVDDEKIGITKFENIITFKPKPSNNKNKRIIKLAMPIIIVTLTLIAIIVTVVVKMAKLPNSFHKEENSDVLDTQQFNDDDLLLEAGDSNNKL